MRILVLSIAYAAGLLAAVAFLAVDNFLYHGFWLPVAYGVAAGVLVVVTLRNLLAPAAALFAVTLIAGIPSLWSYNLPRETLMRFPLLGHLLQPILLIVAAVAYVMALFTARGRWRPSSWLALAVLASCVVAYFSGNSGKPGPMIDLFAQFGLTEEQAQMVVVTMRKIIHFVGYGVVASSGYLAAHGAGLKLWPSIKFGFTYGLLLACFDELRQSGSIQRFGSVSDVLLDVLGMAFFLFVLARRAVRERAA